MRNVLSVAGVAGAGMISQHHLQSGCSASGETEMTVICGSVEDRAAQGAAESNIPRVFKNGEKLEASGMKKLVTLNTAGLRHSEARFGVP